MAEKAFPVVLVYDEGQIRPIVSRSVGLVTRILDVQRILNVRFPVVNKTMHDFWVLAFPYAGPVGVKDDGSVIRYDGDFFCLLERELYETFEKGELTMGEVFARCVNYVCIERLLVDHKVSLVMRNRDAQATVRAYFFGHTVEDMAFTIVQALLRFSFPTREETRRDAQAVLRKVMGKEV